MAVNLPDEAVHFMEQPANSSCFWFGLCLEVRYSIDFPSSVPLPSLCRYVQCSASIHCEGEVKAGGGGSGGAQYNVYVTILTPFVHMKEKRNRAKPTGNRSGAEFCSLIPAPALRVTPALVLFFPSMYGFYFMVLLHVGRRRVRVRGGRVDVITPRTAFSFGSALFFICNCRQVRPTVSYTLTTQ